MKMPEIPPPPRWLRIALLIAIIMLIANRLDLIYFR
jgi:hypothetical protein